MSIDIKLTVGFTILTTMCYKSESRSAITALRKRGVTTKLENNIIGGRGTHITSKRWRDCRAKGYTRHREITGARKNLGIGGEKERTGVARHGANTNAFDYENPRTTQELADSIPTS